jgi:hypothetical protein
MHWNGATVLCLQCDMTPKPVSGLETFPHIDIPFGPPEVMQYCSLWNNQATVK